MLHIIRRKESVSVMKYADPRHSDGKDKLLARFDKDFSVEDTAQEILEFLAALNLECRIVEG